MDKVAGAQREWVTRTVAYAYTFRDPQGDPRRELVGYHWHPHVPNTAFPHVHAYGAPASTSRLHLPTGSHVTLREIVQLMRRDFGVEPLSGRETDWEDALAKADAAMRASLE